MDVAVRLRDIDEHNWMEVSLLTTRPDGIATVCEEYVASNALSMVQALYEESWETKAVYCGKMPVGFVMYGYNNEQQYFELCRLMIDYRQQGKGFGEIALKLVIEEMMEFEDCDAIHVAVDSQNERAKKLYKKFGFEDTGARNGKEEIYRLTVLEE